MYIVKDHQGSIVAIASRKEDALAMTMTIGLESKKILEKKIKKIFLEGGRGI